MDVHPQPRLPAGRHDDSGSVRERMLQLKSLPVMGQLGAADLGFLARHAVAHVLPAGARVLRTGEVTERVYLMTRGSVELIVDGAVVDRLEAPASVGVLPMWAGQPPPYDAVTTEPSVLLEVAIDVMHGFFENQPMMMTNISSGIATALMRVQGGLPLDDSANGPDPGVRPEGPMNFVDRLLLLRDNPFFGGANIDALGELARHQTEVRFAPGDVMWSRGDAPTGAIRIVYGVARAERDGEIARVGVGHRLGGLDSLASQPRSYTAIAETELIGVTESLTVLEGVLQEQPELARRLIGSMASGLLRAQGFRIAGDHEWSPLKPHVVSTPR